MDPAKKLEHVSLLPKCCLEALLGSVPYKISQPVVQALQHKKVDQAVQAWRDLQQGADLWTPGTLVDFLDDTIVARNEGLRQLWSQLPMRGISGPGNFADPVATYQALFDSLVTYFNEQGIGETLAYSTYDSPLAGELRSARRESLRQQIANDPVLDIDGSQVVTGWDDLFAVISDYDDNPLQITVANAEMNSYLLGNLTSLLEKNPRISNLTLKGCQFDEGKFASFAGALGKCECLLKLDLTDSPLTHEQFQELTPWLMDRSVTLNIQGCGIEESVWQPANEAAMNAQFSLIIG